MKHREPEKKNKTCKRESELESYIVGKKGLEGKNMSLCRKMVTSKE